MSWNPRQAVLGVLFVVALAYQVRIIHDTLHVFEGAPKPTIGMSLGRNRPVVVEMGPEAARAGLELGDVVLSIGGESLKGAAALRRILQQAPAKSLLDLVVVRGGSEVHLSLPVRIVPREKPALGGGIFLGFGSIVMPIFCLLLGFWVASRRPSDHRAWILLGLLLSFGFISADSADYNAWTSPFREAGEVYGRLQFTGWTVFLFLFAVYFPKRPSMDRKHPTWKWLFVAPLVLDGILDSLVLIGRSDAYPLAARLQGVLHPWETPVLILQMATFSLFFFLVASKRSEETTPDGVRRLVLLERGAEVAFTPAFLMTLWCLARYGSVVDVSVPSWLFLTCMPFIFVFPLTLAYVVVIERAMDVRVVIRQGVQYAFAQGGVRVVQAVACLVVLALAAAAAAFGMHPVLRLLLLVGATALILLTEPLARRLALFIDRRFFREAYDAQRVLEDLANTVGSFVETGPLLETVGMRIALTLHVPSLCLLVSREGSFAPAFSLGIPDPPSLPRDGGVAHRLREKKDAWRVNRAELEGLSEGEQESLRHLGTELALPLDGKESLLGILSLGPKRSEEPYSGADVRLLRSVAAQTGLALENSALAAAVVREASLRARLDREIEIAREVQERLFPQDRPPIPGFDYDGQCRPAMGVGGDYYDFLALGGECLGLAIGDVSGKGVPAALLMASLQASVRGQTLFGEQDLAKLMGNVNRLVADTCPENRYATFFYAVFDAPRRELRYVNAGHNAPMVFRDGELLRLEASGTPVGLLRNATYEEARLPLLTGDLLVAFTDGISEAMDPLDEEFGEERLIAAVRSHPSLPAPGLLKALFTDTDAFVRGAKQHDDMTLLVARFVP